MNYSKVNVVAHCIVVFTRQAQSEFAVMGTNSELASLNSYNFRKLTRARRSCD